MCDLTAASRNQSIFSISSASAPGRATVTYHSLPVICFALSLVPECNICICSVKSKVVPFCASTPWDASDFENKTHKACSEQKLVGMCSLPRFFKLLPYFNNCDFLCSISDLTKNFITYFRPGSYIKSLFQTCLIISSLVHKLYPISDQNG